MLDLRIGALVLGIAVTATTGCTDGSNPDLVHVRGTITLDGEPLTLQTGTITFVPENGTGNTATSNIDTGGHYELSSFRKGDGVLLGSYRVRIVAYTVRPPVAPGEPPAVPAIPERYFDLATTDLTATIDGGAQIIDFDLKSADP